MDEQQPVATMWQTVAQVAAGIVTGGGLLKAAEWFAGRKDKATDRADKAHDSHVSALTDRIDDAETRLTEMTAAHRDCEKNHATLAGRVGALESQASECLEDRKILRQELDSIRRGGK